MYFFSFSQLPKTKDKKTEKEICCGPFFAAMTEWENMEGSPESLVSCCKMKVLSSVQPWQMLRLLLYDQSLSHQHDPLYVCVPTVTHSGVVRCYLLLTTSSVHIQPVTVHQSPSNACEIKVWRPKTITLNWSRETENWQLCRCTICLHIANAKLFYVLLHIVTLSLTHIKANH